MFSMAIAFNNSNQCFFPVTFVNADGTLIKCKFFLDKFLYISGNLKSKQIVSPSLPHGRLTVQVSCQVYTIYFLDVSLCFAI